MKKIVFVLLMISILLTGCGKYSQKDIVKDLEKKYEESTGYKLNGNLSVMNNDETYNYKVDVSFKKDDFYKVILTNITNNHTQVILKNGEGVFVITPSLNKSFKFQSDWPYKNSQIYLLNALINDIKNDDKKEFEIKDNKYEFKTKVNYPNNSSLVNQKIIMNKSYKLDKVVVYNKDGSESMVMEFDKITYSAKFSKDYFDIDKIISKKDTVEEVKETANLEDTIYPLFLPNGTKLVDEERVKKEDGERVIMTYDGDKSFVLVEETVDVFNEFTVIPSGGEPFQLMDTLGVMTSNSLSWTSSGVEYYLASDVMSNDEMIEVAQSIGGIVSMK
ncbi:MAG: outer membrane lipoprotein carrier protein LolA [Bacilli bacterium]|nr:outer membrane lipoprotein carrier protein LolA [Bacilli bacterium]